MAEQAARPGAPDYSLPGATALGNAVLTGLKPDLLAWRHRQAENARFGVAQLVAKGAQYGEATASPVVWLLILLDIAGRLLAAGIAGAVRAAAGWLSP